MVDAGLVRETGHEAYSFNHALTQQALYTELSSRKRRRLHLAAGEALERQPQRREKRAVELAWHFLQVEDQERALRWSLEAGDQAEAVFAHAEAEHQYRTALTLARQRRERHQADVLGSGPRHRPDEPLLVLPQGDPLHAGVSG
jgi:predicted ATPase